SILPFFMLPMRVARRYCTVCPPSITMAWPTMNAALSEHSQMTPAAISSGLPIRPAGSSDYFCPPFCRAASEPTHHWGVDVSWADGVYAEILTGVIESCRLREANHAVL